MTAADCKGKVLLAYSGGLDTSCILAWLIDQVRFLSRFAPHFFIMLIPGFLQTINRDMK